MIAEPAWLGIGALLILLVALGRSRGTAVIASAALTGVPASWRVWLRWLPRGCRALALASISIALAGPSCAVGARSGLDVLFLVDVSQSMRGLDLTPSRLLRAKEIVHTTIDGRAADRLGLVLFAGNHALACPLTVDHAAFRDRLRQVEPSDSSGTAVPEAILAALDVARRTGTSTAVLVLVTDGVSTAGTGDAAFAAARAFDASVPIIVLQTGFGGLVPMPTDFGSILVDTDDETEALGAVAERSGGRVVDARGQDAVQELGAALAAFDRGLMSRDSILQDVQAWWIGFSILLIAAELVALRCLGPHP